MMVGNAHIFLAQGEQLDPIKMDPLAV